MHPMNLIRHVTLALIQTLMVMAGCESHDRRLADYAQRASEQQARQNERMAKQSETVTRQSQELVSAAHELVEQDAAARRELIQA
jgi:cell division protein ZapA (FtsZ GTPase activity inhibitor)